MPSKNTVVALLACLSVALPVIAEPHALRASAVRHGNNAKRMTRQRRQAPVVGVGASVLGFASSAPAATVVSPAVASVGATTTTRARISDDGLSTLYVATLGVTSSVATAPASSSKRASRSSSSREASETTKSKKATKTSSAPEHHSTSSAASSIAPGTITPGEGCKRYQLIEVGDTCEKIVDASKGKIENLKTFYAWNKGLDAECTNLLAGSGYCVEGPSDTTVKASSTSAAVRASSSVAPLVSSAAAAATTTTTAAGSPASTTGVNAQVIGFASSAVPAPAAAAAAAASSPAPVAAAQQAPGVNAKVLGFGDAIPAASSKTDAAKDEGTGGGYNYRR